VGRFWQFHHDEPFQQWLIDGCVIAPGEIGRVVKPVPCSFVASRDED
jgi:hypothetical protein